MFIWLSYHCAYGWLVGRTSFSHWQLGRTYNWIRPVEMPNPNNTRKCCLSPMDVWKNIHPIHIGWFHILDVWINCIQFRNVLKAMRSLEKLVNCNQIPGYIADQNWKAFTDSRLRLFLTFLKIYFAFLKTFPNQLLRYSHLDLWRHSSLSISLAL